MNPRSKHTPVRLKGKAYHALQYDVWQRDRGHCRICGKYTKAQPHHIKPRSQGGEDTMENLILLCHDCHYQIHHGKVTEYRKRLRQALKTAPAWTGIIGE